jgi:hypothetical protein
MRLISALRLLLLLCAAPLVSLPTMAQSAVTAELAVGSNVFPTESLAHLRFPDGAATGATVTPADQLEVLAVKGELVRVRKGIDMGWAPLSKVTANPSAAAPVAPTDAPPAPPAP